MIDIRPGFLFNQTEKEPPTKSDRLLDIQQQGAVVSPAVPLLVARLKDVDPNVSSAAATVLGDLTLQADIAVPALAECLETTNSYVREEAVEALVKFGDKAHPAVPAIIKALADSEPSVRESATNALARIAPEALGKEEAR